MDHQHDVDKTAEKHRSEGSESPSGTSQKDVELPGITRGRTAGLRDCLAMLRRSDPSASHADDMAGMPKSSELTEYEAFLEAIPQRVRNWVMGFPVGHWRLLNAFSRWGSRAEDLANGHSHALLFMLAHLDQFQHGCTAQDWFRAGELIRGRQREALTALGLEGRESVVRLLRKIPPGTCSVSRLKPLRKLLRDPATYKTLAHLPRINAAVLECIELYDKKLFCTWPLLVEMGESRSDDTAGQAVVDLFVVQMFAESLGCVDRLKPVRSLSQLEALRDELAEAVKGGVKL